MLITRRKFCYLVVLNEKFLTQLASDLFLQIEQVLRLIGIRSNSNKEKALPTLYNPRQGAVVRIHSVVPLLIQFNLLRKSTTPLCSKQRVDNSNFRAFDVIYCELLCHSLIR
ncbi:hypothetical protein D0N37_08485 [Pseudoalteromonas piscicida]|nr:hypothetical protein D0N37_08485 [Pseudoalteromonas piscicida]